MSGARKNLKLDAWQPMFRLLPSGCAEDFGECVQSSGRASGFIVCSKG